MNDLPRQLVRLPPVLFAAVVAVAAPVAGAWSERSEEALQTRRLRPADVANLPSKPADARVPYGTDAEQFGELRLPPGTGPFPVAIVIHGGCWVSRFATLQSTAAMSDALRDVGVATWNVEYRRLDQPGGGWPGTFTDIGAAVDHIRVLAKSHPLDLSRVVVTGHSAGAHLALWAAARHRLPAGTPVSSADPFVPKAAVAIGGPGDIADFSTYDQKICGAPVISQLMGGGPAEQPDRYRLGSPAALLPLGVAQTLVVGDADGVMPEPSRRAYAEAAEKAGDAIDIRVVPDAGHFEVIAPTSAAWTMVRAALMEAVGKRP